MSKISSVKRFTKKVLFDGAAKCWLWTGRLDRDGYGTFWDGNRYVRVHRFSYEAFIDLIPNGHQIDHLCRVRNCVNPNHLEPVTPAENIKRGLTGKVNHRNGSKTHCLRGHLFSGENVYLLSDGRRQCRVCRRARDRVRRQRDHLFEEFKKQDVLTLGDFFDRTCEEIRNGRREAVMEELRGKPVNEFEVE